MLDDNNEIILELKNGKGYGIEYNYDCKYKYIGGYLNGKKNGKGKEYKNIYHVGFEIRNHEDNIKYKLFFEGEYLNGKRHGKGKNYYKENGLKFEGEYLNGKKWNGKGYDMNGKLAYEIKNGNGYIKKYKENDLIFE